MRHPKWTLAADIANNTLDAYSYNTYGYAAWKNAISILLRRGYSSSEVTAIMYSKIPRWAADNSKNRNPTSWDILRYIDKYENRGSIKRLLEAHLTIGA